MGDDLGKTLIVCEKPSAAVKIASALAAKRPRKGDFNGVPYYEFERGGGRMVVVPALGDRAPRHALPHSKLAPDLKLRVLYAVLPERLLEPSHSETQ